jgi:subtilase-type serine protease
VAGAAALLKQAYPFFGPAQLQAFLEGRAAAAGPPGKDNTYGAGLLRLGGLPAPLLPEIFLPEVRR